MNPRGFGSEVNWFFNNCVLGKASTIIGGYEKG